MKKDIYILGISCFFHDSSICLMKNGEVIFAIEEEKLSRIKHDPGFPEKSIHAALNYMQIGIEDIDYVGFYEKPYIKFENFLTNAITTWPFGFWGFISGIKSWLQYKLWFASILEKKFGYSGEIIYLDHHLSHAAGGFFSSDYQKSALLVVDGVGEDSTTSWGVGSGIDLQIKEELHFPNSLGLLYSTFTAYLGFKVNDGEYKMMGLAPYGKPEYRDVIMNNLVTIESDGTFTLNMKYFSFQYGKKMYNKKLEKLFGMPTRKSQDELLEFHMNIASSIQHVIEEILLGICDYIYDQTGEDTLCISGGVALNCVANYKLLKHSRFKNIFVQPSPGDGGTSVGVCYYIYHTLLRHKVRNAFFNIYTGESYNNEKITNVLQEYSDRVHYKYIVDNELYKSVAEKIYDNKIIGWFQGRSEFGPRALGNRSILGNPCSKENWSKINLKIKFRESFRPFAPTVLEKDLGKYFDLEGSFPYMLFVAKTLYIDRIPAVVHKDNTARVQTINQNQNQKYYKLIQAFEKISGVPILINTSFNLAGEPIVYSPEDALKTYLSCEMDCLVLGNYIISKK